MGNKIRPGRQSAFLIDALRHYHFVRSAESLPPAHKTAEHFIHRQVTGMGIRKLAPAEEPPGSQFTSAEYLYRSGGHEQYPWKSLPWKGISKKVLFFDPFSGVTFNLVRMEEGTSFPEHYVTTAQISYLLEGLLRRDDGTLIHPGSFYFIPAGEVQGPVKAESETVQLRYFSGPPVYILSDGSTFVSKSDGTVVAAGRMSFVGGAHPQNLISPGPS